MVCVPACLWFHGPDNDQFSRKTYDFGLKTLAMALTTVSDSTSQKFLLLGEVSRHDETEAGRVVIVHLDFSPTRTRQCQESDFEKWYARTIKNKECLMGHKVRRYDKPS